MAPKKPVGKAKLEKKSAEELARGVRDGARAAMARTPEATANPPDDVAGLGFKAPVLQGPTSDTVRVPIDVAALKALDVPALRPPASLIACANCATAVAPGKTCRGCGIKAAE